MKTKEKKSKVQFHPLAELFPLMSKEELGELSESIVLNGQRDNITIYQGKILDGRNRYLACKMAKVEPIMEEPLIENPIQYVLAKNIHRRHLTPSQKAMLVVDLVDSRLKGRPKRCSQEHLSTEEAAKVAGISKATVRRAKAVKEKGSEKLKAAVKKGDVDVVKAEKVAKLSKPEQTRLLTRGKEALERKAKELSKPRPRGGLYADKLEAESQKLADFLTTPKPNWSHDVEKLIQKMDRWWEKNVNLDIEPHAVYKALRELLLDHFGVTI